MHLPTCLGLKAKDGAFQWPPYLLQCLTDAQNKVNEQISKLAAIRHPDSQQQRNRLTRELVVKCGTAVKGLGTAKRKMQERIKHEVLDQLALANVEQTMADAATMVQYGYEVDEISLVKAKMSELRAPGATDWLQALPTNPEFELPTEELRATLANHTLLPRQEFLQVVGVPTGLDFGCLCQLGDDKPLTEQHMASCRYGGFVVERHHAVVRVLASIAKKAGCLKVEMEPTKLRGYGTQRPDLKYKDPNLAGAKKWVIMDATITAVLPPGAAHAKAATKDPLYKAKQAMIRKVKENKHRMTASQRFVPMAFQATGGYTKGVAGFCKHPGLGLTELPADLLERLSHPLDTINGFMRMKLVMAVVKGTANNLIKLGRAIARQKPHH